MAPPKAPLPARIHAPDFLGINWTKSCWRTPYNNLYPFSICAGSQTRWFSGPLYYGHWHNRTTLNVLRNAVLIAPSALLGAIFFFQADYYDIVYFTCFATGWKMPADIEAANKVEMLRQSREKPGYLLKHKLGGQVSIAGSEINIS